MTEKQYLVFVVVTALIGAGLTYLAFEWVVAHV